jgi:arabinofuranosyltransferase
VLPEAWILARFTAPSDGDSADVRAARHALECAPLADLVASVEEPLTTDRVRRNVTGAPARTWLALPREPAEAERALC